MIALTYFEGVTAKLGKPLTSAAMWDLIHGQRMKWDIAAVRQGDDYRKRSLPGITWQANYDGPRCDRNAKPTGLFMLDIDHVSKQVKNLPPFVTGANDPARALYEHLIKGREDELDIVCVHVSPGGDGLHVIALCQEGIGSIAENQAWLASEIGTPYDSVCYDWARLGFLSEAEDILYFDHETIFGTDQSHED